MIASSPRRVVITGLGLISPLGDTPDGMWESLIAGKSGMGMLKSIPAGSLPISIAAEADCFTGDAENFGPLDKELKKTIRKAQKVMCREIQMGVAAAQRALANSGLVPGQKFDPNRVGCVFGSDYMLTVPEEFSAGIAVCRTDETVFEFHKWATEAFPKLYPLWLLKYLPNMPAAHVSIFNDLRGPNNSITHREAAGMLAVGEAFRTISRGHADAMVTGATGTRIHPMKAIHAVQTEEMALTTDPLAVPAPFDRDRQGMVVGEGAGVLTLEELSHAQARGAKIYGELIGHASAAVANTNGVADRARALELVIRNTLRDAGVTAESVDHINAHGLGTHSCDVAESQAINRIFGNSTPPVMALKSFFGNLGAGSGVVELIGSLLALRHGTLVPTLNYKTADPECPIQVVAKPNVAAGKCFIKLSVTPQGQASGMLIRAWDE